MSPSIGMVVFSMNRRSNHKCVIIPPRNVINSDGFIAKQIMSSMYSQAHRGSRTIWGERVPISRSSGWVGVWVVYLFIPVVVTVYALIAISTQDYALTILIAVMIALLQMIGIIYCKTMVSMSRRRAWCLGRRPVLASSYRSELLVSIANCFMTDAETLRLADTRSDLLDLHFGWSAPLACELAERVASTCSESVYSTVYWGVLEVCSSNSQTVGDLLNGVQAVIDATDS